VPGPYSRPVPNPRLGDAILVTAVIVLVAAGFALLGVCGGGDSLALFAAAVVFLGIALGRSGAWAVVIPISIAGATLVAGAWFLANGAGCRW
jgi:hypothetical protein